MIVRFLHISLIFTALTLFPTLLTAQEPDSLNMSEPSDTVTLEETVITGHQRGVYLKRLTPLKTEAITGAGLAKMACCNLSESFENSATITVGFTDAVSGAKQIQMLGLTGIYTQLLDSNVPTMRGLAATYGWSYIPGPWLDAIYISKGASSVINGYESVTGQIDVEFKKPDAGNSLAINLFGNDALRTEANATGSVKLTDKWSTGLLLHASANNSQHDANHDGFLDQPMSKLFNLYNRWFYINPNGIESRFGLKMLYDERDGGNREHARYLGSHSENRHFNLYNKTGFNVGRKAGQSIGVINSFTHHGQNSAFGLKIYDGTQNSWYTNLLFSSNFGTTAHGYTAGLSFAYDAYRTVFRDSADVKVGAVGILYPEHRFDRNEAAGGAFMQYTWSPNPNITAIAGIRADYNNLHGWLFTPRVNLRYAPVEAVLLRASVGRGYHSPNIIAENIGLMASSRQFIFNEDYESYHAQVNKIGIEQAWNYGVNATFYIPAWEERPITFSVEYFRTDFSQQAVADIERNYYSVYFYPLRGKSYANAWQADLSLTPVRRFDIFAAFRYNITKTTIGTEAISYTLEKPLTARYRGLVNLSYATRLKRWVFDFTAQINGPTRLPSSTGYSHNVEESPAFPMLFTQITRNSKRFDIYAGIENLLDYRQPKPIIVSDVAAIQPYYDASQIWGPLMGRKIYLGIRLRIGEL